MVEAGDPHQRCLRAGPLGRGGPGYARSRRGHGEAPVQEMEARPQGGGQDPLPLAPRGRNGGLCQPPG